jgi:two-component system alkaline phosphatase synthesis response regulator PhoP
MAKILVIEDDSNISELISYNLQENGYETIQAFDGNTGLKLALEEAPDLILLDIMLPGKHGVDICRELRETYHRSAPIIMLTAKGEEIDKILGLEFGADDYITKPFSVRELMARIKAVLRRFENAEAAEQPPGKAGAAAIVVNDLLIDTDRHEVKVGDETVELTFKEFELLRALASNKGKVITREFLLDTVWGFEYIGETRTVDVHVRYLRRKLGRAGDYIQTVRGVGYKIQ